MDWIIFFTGLSISLICAIAYNVIDANKNPEGKRASLALMLFFAAGSVIFILLFR